MTADSRDPSALRAAGGRSPAPAIDSAGNPADGESGGNPAKSVAPRRNSQPPRLQFPACQVCGEPVTRKGFANVSMTAARDRARRRRRGQEQGPLIEWTFAHAACDPAAVTDPMAYLIGVGACRTMRGLMIAVLKVTSRDWAEDTDWRRMVAMILAENRPQERGD